MHIIHLNPLRHSFPLNSRIEKRRSYNWDECAHIYMYIDILYTSTCNEQAVHLDPQTWSSYKATRCIDGFPDTRRLDDMITDSFSAHYYFFCSFHVYIFRVTYEKENQAFNDTPRSKVALEPSSRVKLAETKDLTRSSEIQIISSNIRKRRMYKFFACILRFF